MVRNLGAPIFRLYTEIFLQIYCHFMIAWIEYELSYLELQNPIDICHYVETFHSLLVVQSSHQYFERVHS